VLYPIIMFAWLFFLLKGVGWVWIATLTVSVLGFVPGLVAGSFTLQGIVGGAIGIGLLLLPVTRRYFVSDAAMAST
jgi:hypothetical protein